MIDIKYDDIESIEFCLNPNFTQDYGWPMTNYGFSLENIPTKNKKNIYVITPTWYNYRNPYCYPYLRYVVNGKTIKPFTGTGLNRYCNIYIVNNKYFTVNNGHADSNNSIDSTDGIGYGIKYDLGTPYNTDIVIISDKEHNVKIGTFEEKIKLSQEEQEKIYHYGCIKTGKISEYHNKKWMTNLDKDYPLHIVIYLKEEEPKYCLYKRS